MIWWFEVFYYLWVLIIGILIGSFLNVCIYRIPLGLSVVDGRSFCPLCHGKIRWYHNLPLFSYALLGGRCAYCGGDISPQYPLVELLTGGCFLLLALGTADPFLLACHAMVVSCLIVVAFIDLETGEIPDRFHLIILATGLMAYLFSSWVGLPSRLLGGFIISGPMLFIAYAQAGFGGGDIKLMGVCGFYLGAKLVVLSFFLATIIAASWAMVSLLKKRKALSGQMPFAPYLALGIFIGMTLGHQLLTWYFSRFF